jgi:hypothetical protein
MSMLGIVITFGRDRRGRDRMVVGFWITYAISAITSKVVTLNPAQARFTQYNIMW